MATADVLIGSYPNLELQTMSVTTTGPVTEDCSIAAGNYYLFDDLTAFDLLNVMDTALESHSVLDDVSVGITEGRKIRITSTIAFSLVWPSDGILRDLLGFTGSLTSNTTHTATNISPLLWSPGRVTNWEARVGTSGIPVTDTAVGQSGPGTMVATSFNSYRRNTLTYRYVANSRVWTTSEAGGEFFSFFDNVLRLRRRFKVWRNYVDVEGSTTASNPADSGLKAPLTGAYVYSGQNEMPWGREFGLTETRHPITIPVVSCAEYT